MTREYQPPLSYWKEVRRHESILYDDGQQAQRGLFTEARAAWSAESSDDKAVLWSNARLLGVISTLSVVRLARQIDQYSEVSGNGHFTELHYTASHLALPQDRSIKRYEEFLCVDDINDMDELRVQREAGRQSRRERDAYGLSSAQKEDYELALTELKRGSSGEFYIDDDWDLFRM